MPMVQGEGARVHDVIDALGVGRFHAAQVWYGGGVWLADGAELLLIGSITKSLSKAWDLSNLERGTIVAVLFVGVLIGNFLSGMLGDRYGRRPPIIMSYGLIVVFSLLSACTWDVWSMTIARVLVGISFGIGQPSWSALCSESAPTDSRVLLMGSSMVLFIVGEIYSAALIYGQDPTMHDLSWRILLVLGCVPSLILGILAYFNLQESAIFLAMRGRLTESRAVLDAMRQQNRSDVPIDFIPPPELDEHQASRMAQLHVVFGRHLLLPTLVTCLSTFTANFVYYGGLYAFPQVLPRLDLHLSPAANLVLGAFMEIPGCIIGIVLADRMTRRALKSGYLLFTAISIACFLYGAGSWTGDKRDWAIMVGYMSMKVFVNTGFLVVYLFAAEIYPTSVRNAGAAICVAAGRLGAISSPLIYEGLAQDKNDFSGFFHVTMILCLVNLVAVNTLSIETAGKQLDVIELETSKLMAEEDRIAGYGGAKEA